MPIHQRDSTRINYEIWEPKLNHGTNLITLVNGHTRTLTDFKMMGKVLTAAGFRVLALDNRGSGKTVSDTDFSMDNLADDVVAVMQAESIGTTHLLGISMGGFISQVLACKYPERVKRLILVSTSPSRSYLLNNEHGWVTDAVGIAEKMATYFTPDFIARNRLLFDSMVKQTVKAVAEEGFLAKAEAQRRALQSFQAPHIEDILAETLIIHGEQDAIVDVEAARELERRIPRARINIMKDAGHLLLAEKPKELYDAVIEFLK